MIAPFETGRMVRAAQEDIAFLKDQVAAMMTQLAALFTQVAAEAKRAGAAEAQALALQQRVDQLQAAMSMQTAATASQVARIDELQARLERSMEAVRQGRGDLARVERQIAADLAEVRRLNVDMSAVIVRSRVQATEPDTEAA